MINDPRPTEVIRIQGYGPRRVGDRYAATTMNGHREVMTFWGRKGGMDQYLVDGEERPMTGMTPARIAEIRDPNF